MRVFLLSNDLYLDSKKISDIDISITNDIIILFNHARPIKYTHIQKCKNKILFIRRNHLNSYWGYNNALRLSYLYRKLVLVDRVESILYSIKNFYSDYDVIDTDQIPYPKNKFPTTGFVAYQYARIFFSEYNIHLVNFTGKSNGRQHWNGHDYVYEQNYYITNNVSLL